MDLVHHLRKQFEYNAWANREVLDALRTSGKPPAAALKRLAHIVAVEQLWLARLGLQKNIPAWPGLSLLESERVLADLPERWHEYLHTLTPEKLEARIPYVNSEGEPWTNSVEDILAHVLLHSAYHRGQIAADMRTAGQEPAYTDYIHAIRQSRVVG